jgi:hypothetical protein
LPRILPRGVPPLRSILLVLVLAASAGAGVRTRALPEPPGGVEPQLRARAAAADPASRLHALAEVPRSARAVAEAAGIRLLRPAGGNLWLVSLPAAAVPDAAAVPGVARIWDLGPGDRSAPGLAERIAARPPADLVELRLKVFSDESPDGVVAAVRAAGGSVRGQARALGVVDAAVPAAALPGLAARDDVRWIEPAPPVPEDTNNGLRFDAEVNPVQSTLGVDGTGVIIGMWDAGLPNVTHPDLAGRVTAGESGMSTHPHSAHVAGTAIGDGTNSVLHGGSADQWRGVATGATLVSYTNVGAVAEMDSAIALFDVDVANNSWVYPVSQAALTCSLYGDYASDAPELDDVVRGIYGKKLPVVFSAGNERDDGDCGLPVSGYRSIPPPATAKNVLTVGAHFNDQQYMTPFSSWGPTDDGRLKPEISAPGCQQFGDFGVTSTTVGGGYLSMCGTSMAAPAVSGSIAALLQEWRARFPSDPRPATYKVLLGNFAKDRASSGPDYRFGLGALNLFASVTALQTATTVEDDVDDALTDVHPFFVPAGAGTLLVTLAWDDPAAAELADPALINDLDLELTGPTTGPWQAFVLDPANPDSLAVPGSNRRDNIEQVRVLAPESGWWEARVSGYSVAVGPQEYSLAGFDLRAPADPAALQATATDDTTIALTWIRAGDTDRAGTLVVRSESPVAWTPATGASYLPGAEPAPGVLVVAADDVDRQGAPLDDAPLSPGTPYHYAAFSYDEIPNYSAGSHDSATTTTVAVDASPAVEIGPGRPAFARQGANPFRDRAVFRFELPAPAIVAADVYDVRGRRVARLIEGPRKAGAHRLEWDGRGTGGVALAGGVYFVRFRTAGLTAVEKVVLVR